MATFRIPRGSTTCCCSEICKRVKTRAYYGSDGRRKTTKRTVGNPRVISSTSMSSCTGTQGRLCVDCLSQIYPGCIHQCGRRARKINLESLFTKSEYKDQLLRKHEEVLKKRSSIIQHPLSNADMISLKNDIGLSNKQTLRVARTIRSKFGSMALEVGLKTKLTETNSQFKEFFSEAKVFFPDDKKLCHFVWCHDLRGFIDHVMEVRVCGGNEVLRFSIDKGGTTLKITMSIIKHASEEQDGERNSHSSNGVLKMFCVGLGYEVSEGYLNCKKMLRKINLNSLEYNFKMVCDLKMINILCGMTSHASSFPCPYCTWRAGTNPSGNEIARTFLFNATKNSEWIHSGQERKTLKEFFNVQFPPLFHHGSIIEVFPPPSLHLTLGLVNRLFDGIEALACDVAHDWATSLYLRKENYHGGCFTGRACTKLLRNIDNLDSLVQKQPNSDRLNHFVNAFRDLKDVNDGYLGQMLACDLPARTEKFKQSYMLTGLSISSKAHVMFEHVLQFTKITGESFLRFSEQAHEASHYSFEKTWFRYSIKNTHNPKFGANLLRAVLDFNGCHL